MNIKKLQRYTMIGNFDIADDKGKYCKYDDVTELEATNAELYKALEDLLDRYSGLVNCGDCGNWDPEKEDEVITARKALASAKGDSNDS